MAIKSKKIDPKLTQKYLESTTMEGRSCTDDSQRPSLDIKESAPCSALSKILDKSLSPKEMNKP